MPRSGRAPDDAEGALVNERIARLTARERKVLAMLGQGLSDQDIAGRLGIGAGTVKPPVGAVLDKAGSASRVRAALPAHRTAPAWPGLAWPPEADVPVAYVPGADGKDDRCPLTGGHAPPPPWGRSRARRGHRAAAGDGLDDTITLAPDGPALKERLVGLGSTDDVG
ncbi:helix-turn-helix transcriptional regulator [Streptomyces globisporus]|uniref:helix-turn-helix domain-containing protein n=1 Tax=Streptomyces globisporus TaxID=1908 RepID=UPI0006906EB2|nr:helix-turn-helix transcriptional regulator [Streptomyces globisporus]